jgi:hypothetical protein
MKVMSKFMKTDNRKHSKPFTRSTPVFQRLPLMTKEEVQAVLEVAKSLKAPQAKAEDFFDNSLLQKLEVFDFIDSLYARSRFVTQTGEAG